MNYKKLLILTIILTLHSCAVVFTPVSLERKSYNDAPIGETIEKEIGESLVTKGQEDYQEAVKIKKPKNFNVQMISFPYDDGEILPLSGMYKNWKLYYNKNKAHTNTLGVAVHKEDENHISIFSRSGAGFSVFGLKNRIEATKTTYTNPNCENCYKQELVYNGKSGNTVRFMYREYVNNMARPAFSQDLQYDLSESKIIGIKGLRMEVFSAGNTKIKYKIIKSFD